MRRSFVTQHVLRPENDRFRGWHGPVFEPYGGDLGVLPVTTNGHDIIDPTTFVRFEGDHRAPLPFVINQLGNGGQQCLFGYGRRIQGNRHPNIHQIRHVPRLVVKKRKSEYRHARVHSFVYSGYASVADEQFHVGMH